MYDRSKGENISEVIHHDIDIRVQQLTLVAYILILDKKNTTQIQI